MPAPYSAGSIFLQVVPSFRGVPEQIAREAREWPDHINDSGFDEKLEKNMQQAGRRAGKKMGEELGREVSRGAEESAKKAGDSAGRSFSENFERNTRAKRLFEQLEREGGPTAERAGKEAGARYAGRFRESMLRGISDAQREIGALKVDVDDREAHRKLQDLKSGLKGLEQQVRVGVDSGQAFRTLEAMERKARELHDAAGNLEFRSNIGGVIRDMERIRAGIQDLSRLDIEPNLKLDRQLGHFERRLKDGVKSALNDLPPVRFDDTPAHRQIKELRTALLALGDVDIGVDMDSAAAFAELARLEAILHTLADTADDMKLRVDAAGALRTVAAVRSELEGLSRMTIEPELELDRQVGAFERGLRGAIDGALRELGARRDQPLGLDTVADRDIQRIRRELLNLSDLRIGIDVSAETARETIQRLHNDLEQLQREHWSIDIDADVAAAHAALQGFLAALNRVDGSEADVDVNVRGAAAAAAQLGAVNAATRRSSQSAQDGANSFRAFNIRILGVAALGPLVVPALGAIAGAIAGLLPLAAAAAAGIGVLVLGLFGVGDAFKAMGEARRNSQEDAEAYAKGVRTAANGVADAERGISRAREDAARGAEQAARQVEDAERDVARAREDAALSAEQSARQVEDALRGVRDAERGLRDAQRDARMAQEDLTRAREEAAEQLEDLNLQVRGGAIDQRQAALDLREAEQELADARREGLGGDELERYIIALDRAKLRVDQTAESNGDLAEQAAEWARTGIEGSDGVVAAQERVRQANQGVADAEEAVADAQRAVSDARIAQARQAVDSQQAIADAQRNLADAQINQSRQAVDSQQAIADAQRTLRDAQIAYTEAINETSSSQDKLKESMANLGPAGQEFVTYLDSLRPRMRYLRSLAQEGFLPGLQEWISAIVNDQGPLLERVIMNISGALGDMFSAFARSINGPSFRKFFNFLADSGPRMFGYLTDFLVNLSEGFVELIVAMEPLGDTVGGWLVDLTKNFKDWASSLQGTEELQNFFEYVAKVGPAVGELLWTFVEALINLGKALTPYAFGLMDVLTDFFEYIAGLDPDILGPITVGLLGAVLALQAIFAIASLLISIRVAAHLTGLALGGIVTAMAKGIGILGLFAGAFLVLYTQSEDFRKAVNTLWTDVLQPFFGWLAEAIGWVLEPFIDLLAENLELVASLVGIWAGWKILLTVVGWVNKLAFALGLLSAAQATAAASGALGAGAARAGAAGAVVGTARRSQPRPPIGAGTPALAGANAARFGALGAGAAGAAAAGSSLLWPLLIGGAGFIWEQNTLDEREEDWAQRLMRGGADAAEVERQFRDSQETTTWENIKGNLLLGDIWDTSSDRDLAENYQNARKAADDYFHSLGPLEQAQMKVAEWEETLAYRTEKHGKESDLTAAAQRRYDYWTRILTGGLEEEDGAISAVNAEMATQQSLIISLTDAEEAYRLSRLDLTEAYENYDAVMNDVNATEEDRRLAEQAWADQSRATAEAARQLALTRHANADELEREAYGNAALLVDLERQKKQYGELPPHLERLRTSLAETVDPTILMVTQMENLGLAVVSIPDDKTIHISGDTPQTQLDTLRTLGLTVTELPDGSFAVTANTEAAAAALAEFIDTERHVDITASVSWPEHIADRRSRENRDFQDAQGWMNGPFAPRGNAAGGPIFGPGTWTSDSIPAWLSNGEYVIRAASVAKYGLDFFDALNEGRLGQRATGFRRGGRVKQGLPAFQEGGLAVNWGGTMSISGGNLSPLAAPWAQAVSEINNLARTGVNIMAAALGIFGQLARATFQRTAGDLVRTWGSLIRLMNTSTQGLSISQIRLFTSMFLGITRIMSTLQTQQQTAWLTMSLTAVRLVSGMVSAVNRLFEGMRATLLSTSSRTVSQVYGTWARLPALLANPANIIISRVINQGLVNAFNSIAGQLGTGARPLTGAPVVNLQGTKLAAGGPVPGWSPHDKADNIPAWLTAGEFVQPVDVVNYYGPEFMEAIRKKQIPREAFGERQYAAGGYVAMSNVIMKKFPWARITSGYRPGDPGYHGKGMAIDIGGSTPYPGGDSIRQMLEINRWIAQAFANITELIHTSPGAINLWHGRPHTYSAGTQADHRNHVHWAQAIGLVPGGMDIEGLFDPKATLGKAVAEALQGFPNSRAHNIMAEVPRKLVQYAAARLDQLISSAAFSIGDGALASGAGLGGSTAQNRALVQRMAAARGWVGSEWSALDALIMKESGYRNTAQNPTSTAYGMFQFLNSTWAGYGIPKTSDPALQTEAGFRYIASRYGSPSGALRFHLANNWYAEGGPVQDIDSASGAVIPDLHDMGGVIYPGLNVLMNRTNRPEAIINPQTMDALVTIADRGGAGSALIGQYHQTVASGTPREAAEELLHALDVADLGGRYGRKR